MSGKVTKYIVIYASSIFSLKKKIKEYLELDYQFLGEVSVQSTGMQKEYYQKMVLKHDS